MCVCVCVCVCVCREAILVLLLPYNSCIVYKYVCFVQVVVVNVTGFPAPLFVLSLVPLVGTGSNPPCLT